ncbi:hypothetical protein ORIO_20055 (plasmid) [Cereibacter azotoformans]|uniref:hypothetical protein n=1 Tax=Cereibacter azotoformans TaxID=43057 RepID=UPI001EEBD335|nr:hypothetical protein [Cereibacter azotoformans]ULB12106.1 hypothetical protein ORIO_20055 [Cereibacter azotoformans]
MRSALLDPTRPVRRAAAALVVALALLTGGFSASPALACDENTARLVPRTILALHDGGREGGVRQTRLHRAAEMILNHMGYVLDYHDVAAGPPPPLLPAEVAATLSWFDAPLARDADFARWAASVERDCGGLRMIAFDHVGIRPELAYDGQRDAYLSRLGLRVSGGETALGVLSRTVAMDAAMIGHETPFDIEQGRHAALEAVPPARSLLRVEAAPGAPAFDLVVLGPRGAFADSSATLRHDARGGLSFWVLDPFAFFEAALGQPPAPVPDVTTEGGRRLFFSVVRPEGWLVAEPALRFGQETRIGSELLLDRLVAPYPDLPVSIGVLTGDLDATLAGPEAPRGRVAARALFALPQVRPGTAGHSLVRTWAFFDGYDPAREAQLLRELRGAADPGAAGLIGAAVRTLELALPLPAPVAASRMAEAPRRYMRDPFDLWRETAGALAEVSELAGGRPAGFHLWTGDASPHADALASVAGAGAAGLGGGGGIYNRFAPALSNLSAYAVREGGRLQVYNALSGDEAYTGFWTTPEHGFHAFADTVRATGSPRRLRPFQLGFAASSALSFGTRTAVEAALGLARASPVLPVAAADYVRIVEGFHSARLRREGERAWRITNRGALQTLRVERAAGLALDLAASRGVLGAVREEDRLYIALNPSDPEPLVALAEDPAPLGMRGLDRPALVSSRFRVLDFEAGRCRIALRLQGWAPGVMDWQARPGTRFAIDVRRLGASYAVGSAIADPEGRLSIQIPDPQGADLDVTLDGDC